MKFLPGRDEKELQDYRMSRCLALQQDKTHITSLQGLSLQESADPGQTRVLSMIY